MGDTVAIQPLFMLKSIKSGIIRNKSEYLEAWHDADMIVGNIPLDGTLASLQNIRPFLQYFKGLVANEVYTDVCFLTEHQEDLWWYDGEHIEFCSHNNSKLLMLMISEPVLTLNEMQKYMNINM